MDSEDSDSQRLSYLDADENFDTAYHVYKHLWDQFYGWSDNVVSQTLQGLTAPRNLPSELPHLRKDARFIIPSSFSVEEEWFTYVDLDDIASTVTTFALPCILTWAKHQTPHPRYTACTPCSSIIHSRDTPDTASFAPFADHPGFDLEVFLGEFKSFNWQLDMIDPDSEMIQLEAARRLHYAHGFKFTDIDSFGLFSFPLRGGNRQGLIWYSSQRDHLWWPGSQTANLHHLPTHFVDHNLDTYDNILKDMTTFCPNLNCIITSCNMHKEETKPIHPPKAQISNERFRSNLQNPCDQNCYKTANFEMLNVHENSHWNENDISDCSSIIRLSPDTAPCDLAIICRKPCVEVPIFNGLENNLANVFIDFCPAVSPCYHAGPCNQYADCGCYREKQRCQRTCRCLKDCQLRYSGCTCHVKKNGKEGPCSVYSDCECVQLDRECDPELCVKCDAR
ncbi:hypothetical protein B0H34DRAFT_658746 [Crassisporium funariophilum]|nr:hypothetical protein B0H34DRAFT_658746 [Crassisporium funariophilum]